MISNEPMVPIVSRIKAWWEAADRQQRIVTLGGSGALLLLLVGTAFVATRPHYETILEGLSELEQAQDRDALTLAGIPAQVGDRGTLMVPSSQAKEAKMKLALDGKLPKGKGHITLPELKDMNPMDPPEKQAQQLKMIQEGEIRSILETMDGVSAANVIVTQPQKSAFADDERNPTASVSLTEDVQDVLTAANGKTIANLVCSAVDGMTLQDVFVSTSSGRVMWDGHSGETTGMKADLDAKVARDWEMKVRNALEAFGPENVKVAVRADVDTSKRHTRTHDVTPTDRPIRVVSKAETMQGATQRPGGLAGSPSNMPNPAAPATSANGGANSNAYDGKDKSSEYEASTKDEDVEGGIGDLKGLAITVSANSDTIPASEVPKAQMIVDGLMGGLIQRDAAGVAVTNQPFSAIVASVKFDKGAELAAKAAAEAAAGRERMQQIFSMLPIGAILLVALVVAKQVGKISKSVFPVPTTMETVLNESMDELPESEMALPGEGLGALPMPGEGDVEETFKLEVIKDRVDPALEGLKQMATERPEMVATLIKSMMLGERA